MNATSLIGAALLVMAAVMAAAWLTQRQTGNGGWIDVFWTYGTGAVGVALALLPLDGVYSVSWRQILIASLVGCWSLRLGTYVALRVAKSPEDARYVELKREWGTDFHRRAFWFTQIQGPIATLLGVAVMVAAHNPLPGFRFQDLAAFFVLAISIGGEALADRQMQQFKSNPANRGRICETGLWRYSRHPNYFFDWLGWWAYLLFAINFSHEPTEHWPWGWAAILAPAMMFWIFVKLTGIPMTEAVMAKSRGAAFEDYKRRTSAFIPLPPRA